MINKKINEFARIQVGQKVQGGSMYGKAEISLEDFIYLPSHMTMNRRKEMERKFGDIINRVDRNVSSYSDCCNEQLLVLV
jgi:hypothetical protein